MGGLYRAQVGTTSASPPGGCHHNRTWPRPPVARIFRSWFPIASGVVRLREKGIYSQIHYIPIYRQPFFEDHYGYEQERFPETEKYFSSCLSLPLFPDLSDRDFHYVTDTLLSLMT